MQVKDEAKAIDLCSKVAKPPDHTKSILNKLFPVRAEGRVAQKRRFDPSDKSVAELSKAKKKAAVPRLGGKLRSVTIVLLDTPVSVVPKGKARRALEQNGRVRKAKIHRSMSASDIREVVCKTFSNLPCARKAKFMCCGQDNYLRFMSNQDLSGDEVVKLAGSGSVYMCEVSVI